MSGISSDGQPPPDPPRAPGRRFRSGPGRVLRRVLVATAMLFGTALTVVGGFAVYAVFDIARELDRFFGVDLVDPAHDHVTLQPGMTATYEDDVRITVSDKQLVTARGEESEGRTFEVTLVLANRGDEEDFPVRMENYRSLKVWAGTLTDQYEFDPDHAVRWTNREAATRRLPNEIAPGNSVTVRLRFRVAAGHDTVIFCARTPHREAAFWRLEFD